jgi:lipopolysaccharide/colanic/teichoic acid biosynthesis glycosyltransferase
MKANHISLTHTELGNLLVVDQLIERSLKTVRRNFLLSLHHLKAEWPTRLKRALDISLTLPLVLLLSPFILVMAFLIRLDGGPIFFTQRRVGRHGKCFNMIKFRSMRVKAEQDLKALLKGNQHHNGVTFKMKKDPRITPLGRIMRRCSIDELPQLFNVLKGDMSLVGPRPPVPREVAHYTPEDRKRLSVIPGITCIWQVSGRSEIDFPDQVKLDIRYIQNQGLLEDLKILFLTIPAVISGKGAY